MLALLVHHGWTAAWETSGILLIETFGSYLLARTLIRNQDDFRAVVRVFLWLVGALLPFAIVESLTDRALLEALPIIGEGITEGSWGVRYGFYRANVTFEHPILYGTFAASGLGLVYYALRPGTTTAGHVFRNSIVAISTICSFSAGPLVALVSQFGLIGWARITQSVRNNWRLLGILIVVAYIAVDMLSTRSPFQVFVTYFTFSSQTGYGRIVIWEYGFAEVMRNPLLGIGLREWERPLWLGESVDNLWLLVAMRYGIPALVFLGGALIVVMGGLGRLTLEDDKLRACRAGILVTLAGLIISACTVHYWNALYAWFMFLVGSGVWLLDVPAASQSASDRRLPRRAAAPTGRTPPRLK